MARTVFVNPRRRRKPARRTKRKNTGNTAAKLAYARGKAAGMQMTKNPRRRKSTRRRRRNAGVVPFVQNPLILSNPRRRTRRRRKNPGLPTMKTALNRTMSFGGGAAIGVAANTFLLNNIESPLMRNAARVGAAVLGAGFLRGELGGATGGALMYPAIQELMDTFMGGAAGVASTDADLDVLAADLEDVMDELDMDEDDEDVLYEW